MGDGIQKLRFNASKYYWSLRPPYKNNCHHTRWQDSDQACAAFLRNLAVVLLVDMMPSYRKLPTTVRVDTSNPWID